ncbi:MAG: cobalamin-dependent protein, partial [Caldicoprobacter sp.]|uniref:cobalamin-dependent protein n=1 Tax=Caldicoprobacter sp. TaxID=2004500 RepID=UPI0039C04FDD
GIDDASEMVEVIDTLVTAVDAPLCLDSSNIEALERGLRIYPGRALVNSISLEKDKIEKLLPVAAKYGAMFILLPLTDEGVPLTARERQKVVEEVFERAALLGYQKEDIVVDGLVMAVSSNQGQAVETLSLIDWCSNRFGCNTIVGLSNVSFGLPERGWLNAAFLAMAMGKGLTMAIVNPLNQPVMNVKMASEVLLGRDVYSQKYIKYFTQAVRERGDSRIKVRDDRPRSVEYNAEKGRSQHQDGAAGGADEGGRDGQKTVKQGVDGSAAHTTEGVLGGILKETESRAAGRDDVVKGTLNEAAEKEKAAQQVFDAVVKGDHHGIVSIVEDALARDISPRILMDEYLIPAITHVGELFERKEYFLPQLLMSAEAMKKAFEHIEPLLQEEAAGASTKAKKTKVILATVKGDIHDIGKNIVALMLRNHGFEVIDLGKDVSAETIIEKAKETGAQIIGLSALMTTTMVYMKEVIELARKEGLKCKFMVGGAAVTRQFADEIGADGYAEDANSAVKLAKRLAEEG